jgi:hypothetical protein
MRLLVGINGSAFEPGVNLVAQLATSELDALGRVKLRHKDGEPLCPEMFGHATKILDAEALAKTKNSMNQDYVHGPLY